MAFDDSYNLNQEHAIMSADQAVYRVQLTPMPQLTEAVDKEDDWTGLTDAAARRKKQNRLNVRAYRRRKALTLRAHPESVSTCDTSVVKTEPELPCWVEDEQTIISLPVSVVRAFNSAGTPLIPYSPGTLGSLAFQMPLKGKIIFPLSQDHLITLLQFNVLRACMTNRQLLFGDQPITDDECSSTAVHISPTPSSLQDIPHSFHPTALQLTVPHDPWIDITPHPVWRDNLILATGTYDEDELWSDIVGGLFEGFPDSEVERSGMIAWSPPWDVSGWELSEGFWRKWGWSLKGCEDVLIATNKWRMKRGEKPLRFKILD